MREKGERNLAIDWLMKMKLQASTSNPSNNRNLANLFPPNEVLESQT